MKYITTQQAADLLGVTRAHVRWLIGHEKLVGKKFGRDFQVEAKSVEAYARDRPPLGRPKKNLSTDKNST